jgi:hypothetical protein
MATKGKAGGERVFYLAGTQATKGKTGKEQRTILLRPAKRVADKLGLRGCLKSLNGHARRLSISRMEAR